MPPALDRKPSVRKSSSRLPALPSFRGSAAQKAEEKALKEATAKAAREALAEKAAKEAAAAAEAAAKQKKADELAARRKEERESARIAANATAGETFTEAERALFRGVFDDFDADKSGEIDIGELDHMVESLGLLVSKAQLALWLADADADKSGEIDFVEFMAVIARARDSAPSGFASTIARKRNSGPPMKWRQDKKGPGVEVTADGRTIGRRHDGRWGVQLLDTWLNGTKYDSASVLLEFGSVAGEGFVGVVGANYNPGEWDGPLSKSIHASAARVDTGDFYTKGRHDAMAKCAPIASGCRVAIEIDVLERSMTLQVVRPSAGGAEAEAKILSSVRVDELPAELAVAVAFGPGEGPPWSARIVGSSSETTGRDKNKKTHAGLHDAENKQSLADDASGYTGLKLNEVAKVALSLED